MPVVDKVVEFFDDVGDFSSTKETISETIPELLNNLKTRKSSCVNARGIPTATYQVLHLLPEVGYPQARSNGGGYPQQGYPLARSDGGT